MSKSRRIKRTRRNSNNTLLIMLIVIAISILVIYYIYHNFSTTSVSSQPSNQQYIPLYVDSLTYKIDTSSVSSIVFEIINSNQRDSINLIAFGRTTCPHCKNLHEFFKTYFKDRYVFLWVENTNVATLFNRLAQIEWNSGVPPNYAYAIPQTIVVRHGEPVAIVIGAILDVNFWENLLS